MAALPQYVCILWVAVAVLFFIRYPRPFAVILTCLLGTLFLPEVQSSPVAREAILPIRVTLLEFSKVNVMSYGLLLGLLLFDAPRLGFVKWNIFDLPAFLLSIFPAMSSLLNDGSWDVAFAECRAKFFVWTVPYVVGRVYLSDIRGVRLVTLAIAAGGLIYIPLCLFEVRFASVLHYRVWGFQQHDFSQTVRLGGYRPMVFMQHGLAVGLWMVAASLCLVWLWRTGNWPTPNTISPIRRYPRLTLAVQLVTTALCKSMGALAVGSAGAIALVLSSRLRTRVFVAALLIIPPIYIANRILGLVASDTMIALVGQSGKETKSEFKKERSESLEFRLFNEDKLMEIMGSNYWYGMGGGPLSRPKDSDGRLIIPDSQWVISYYDTGLWGLAALLAFFLVPPARFLYLHKSYMLTMPIVAPATVAAVVLAVVMSDCLLNSMLNPMYILLAAALNGWNTSMRDPQFQATVFCAPPNVVR